MIQFFGPIAPQCTGAPLIGGEPSCSLCDLLTLIDNVVKFTTQIAVLLVVIFIIWGAFLILTSAGDTKRVASGRKIITGTVVGLIIILGAWIIISTTFLVITGSYEGIMPMPWYRITC